MEGRPSEGRPSNQQPHEVYVNESGLYSLVLRSQKEEARILKRWVTSEVLPSIRQSGGVVHVIQHKVLCTAKPQCSDEERRLLDAGRALSSEEVEFLNELENIVQLSTWLDSRVRASTREEESLVPLMWSQGGHRIVYTMADEELLLDVLQKLRPKFEATMRWYCTMKNRAKKQKQATLHKYLKKKAGASSASTEAGEEGYEETSSADSMET